MGYPSTWYLKDEETRKRVLDNLKSVCYKGGRITGPRNAESGHMAKIQSEIPLEKRIEYGKIAADTCRELKVNAFFDPKLRTEIARKGGRVQGAKNAASGHCKEISQKYWEDVKNGTKMRTKKEYYYSIVDKKSILVGVGETPPSGYIKGRKIIFD